MVTEFQLANDAQPRDIVGGPDGNLWFTEYQRSMDAFGSGWLTCQIPYHHPVSDSTAVHARQRAEQRRFSQDSTDAGKNATNSTGA